jgi:4-amino-4-deoxy-L-arabinose transferase-like glycosyltransferase
MGSSLSNAQAQAKPEEDSVLRARSNTALLRPAMLLVIGILLLITLIFGAIRFRLRNMPLERDEGEYAYSGQLLLQGIPPYKLAYNLKLPGIYATYAIVLATFGQTAGGIHLGLLLVNACTILLVYILAARLFGRLSGLVAAASYALLSASPSVMGFEAHATNFVLPPVLLGILLLLEGSRLRNRWLIFGSGLLCGIGFLMKQHGVFFAFFCGFYLLLAGWKQRQGWREFLSDIGALGAGFILPYAVTCWLLFRAGVFQQFWFWTVSYAGEYSKMGLHRGVHSFVESYGAILHANPLIWIIALMGLLAPLWSVEARKHWGFTGLLLLFSFLSLCPGAYFRPHYFILLLPVIGLLTGIAVGSTATALVGCRRGRAATLIPIFFLGALGLSIFQQRELYFSLDPAAAMEATYGTNPFLAAMKAADYVRQNSPEDARIAVLGSEPEIYFYARRRSATGYLYMYSLIVRQKYTARMQQELIHEVETNRPEYLIYADVAESWGAERGRAPQAAAFLNWVLEYTQTYYDAVGVAETGDSARDAWGDAAKGYKPTATEAIYVMKRKQQ